MFNKIKISETLVHSLIKFITCCFVSNVVFSLYCSCNLLGDNCLIKLNLLKHYFSLIKFVAYCFASLVFKIDVLGDN